jgi:outer membrane receptor protein involved in Fe transport
VAYFPTTPAERLPFYARLDASLGYRFSLLGLRWNAEMQFFNLTDRTNYVDQVYLIDQANPNPFEGQGFQSTFNLKVVW